MLDVRTNLDGMRWCYFSWDYFDEIRHLLSEAQLDCISINVTGFSVRQMEQLQSLTGLKSLCLYIDNKAVLAIDFSVFPDLKQLAIIGCPPSIDFSKLKSLRHLSCDWREGMFENMDDSGLEELTLIKHKAVDLSFFKSFKTLKKLYLNSTISSLNGIQYLVELKDLELDSMRNLADISAIADVDLQELKITNAKKIKSYESLAECRNIEHICIHQSASIASLYFVETLSALQSFRFLGTDVLDGDLTLLLPLNFVAFTEKKHFSHKAISFKKIFREC